MLSHLGFSIILYCVIFGPRYQNSILRMEIHVIYWLQRYKNFISLKMSGSLLSNLKLEVVIKIKTCL
ncbi:hypothetical protein Hanom_Chr05g00453741 [Helianthus anomalus]